MRRTLFPGHVLAQLPRQAVRQRVRSVLQPRRRLKTNSLVVARLRRCRPAQRKVHSSIQDKVSEFAVTPAQVKVMTLESSSATRCSREQRGREREGERQSVSQTSCTSPCLHVACIYACMGGYTDWLGGGGWCGCLGGYVAYVYKVMSVCTYVSKYVCTYVFACINERSNEAMTV